MQLAVRVASITGNAEMIAEDAIDAISDDVDCQLELITDGSFEELLSLTHLLIVSSTYGVGDVPDNGMTVYDRLVAEKPDLGQLKYGVIGLGDSTYADTFAFGGRKWDSALTDCGATRLGEILILDASEAEDPTERAIAWIEEWVTLLNAS